MKIKVKKHSKWCLISKGFQERAMGFSVCACGEPKINPDVYKKGVESKLDNIEKSIGNLKTMSEFVEDYKDFVGFILKINKEAEIGAMRVKSIILSNHWTIKYPFLLQDIRKITGELKLFGIEIVARLEE